MLKLHNGDLLIHASIDKVKPYIFMEEETYLKDNVTHELAESGATDTTGIKAGNVGDSLILRTLGENQTIVSIEEANETETGEINYTEIENILHGIREEYRSQSIGDKYVILSPKCHKSVYKSPKS